VFYHYISGVDLIYSSDSVATRFDDMCRYLRIPVALHTLFDGSPQWAVIPKLATKLVHHSQCHSFSININMVITIARKVI